MKILLALALLLTPLSAFAQGNGFDVRYNGGTLETKVKRDDWKNSLNVSDSAITLRLKDGQALTIDPQKVTRLSYGKNATRSIGKYAVAGAIVAPVLLLGMLKKNKQHFVGIEYDTADGKKGAILLQIKNDQYRGAMTALRGVTGKEFETEEKEKK
jgi:hypothetical protein